MFPLAGNAFPTSADELAASIEQALAGVFVLPGPRTVVVEGQNYPALDTMRINLSGATIRSRQPPPRPEPPGSREPGVRIAQLEVTGQPMRYEQTELNLKVTGSGLVFDFARDRSGNPLLVLTAADDGHVEAKIAKRDIEALLTEAATAAAKQQGIVIQGLDLQLRQDGARSVAAEVRVRAKKLLMAGTILITGRLDIDDELKATVSRLNCTGEGMVGTIAAGIVQQKMRPYDGMSVPLMAFSLGDVALRDLKLAVTDAVEVSAAFGRER